MPKDLEKSFQKTLAFFVLTMYSLCMDTCLADRDVLIKFSGMMLSKSRLKTDKQMGTVSVALKFMIGPVSSLLHDPLPMTAHALWTLIAEGSLALWIHQQLPTPCLANIEAVYLPDHPSQLHLKQLIPIHHYTVPLRGY